MNLKQAEQKVGGLSQPSKMPSYGWSISAKRCNTGSKLAKVKGSVCYNCYALKGRYMFNNVQTALDRRFNSWSDDRESFIKAMIFIMHNKQHIINTGVFRWFDSGDIQGIDMLTDINRIAKATPHVKHWLPTKEYKLMSNHNLDIAFNLTLRVSNPTRNKSFKGCYDYVSAVFDTKVNIDHPLSVAKDSYMCPAPKQNNECGSCRACWDKSVEEVVYKAH